jgi:hypothetical protein
MSHRESFRRFHGQSSSDALRAQVQHIAFSSSRGLNRRASLKATGQQDANRAIKIIDKEHMD